MLTIRLGPPEDDNPPQNYVYHPVEEVVRRIIKAIPEAREDQEAATRSILEELERHERQGTPEMVIAGLRSLVGWATQIRISSPEHPDDACLIHITPHDSLVMTTEPPGNRALMERYAEQAAPALGYDWEFYDDTFFD